MGWSGLDLGKGSPTLPEGQSFVEERGGMGLWWSLNGTGKTVGQGPTGGSQDPLPGSPGSGHSSGPLPAYGLGTPGWPWQLLGGTSRYLGTSRGPERTDRLRAKQVSAPSPSLTPPYWPHSILPRLPANPRQSRRLGASSLPPLWPESLISCSPRPTWGFPSLPIPVLSIQPRQARVLVLRLGRIRGSWVLVCIRPLGRACSRHSGCLTSASFGLICQMGHSADFTTY